MVSMTISDDDDSMDNLQEGEEDSDQDESESPGLRKKRKALESLPVSRHRKWRGDVLWGGNIPLRPMKCYAELKHIRVKFNAKIRRLQNPNLILVSPTGKKVGKKYSRIIYNKKRWGLIDKELNLYIRSCSNCKISNIGNCWIRLCGYYKTVKKFGNAKLLNVTQDNLTDEELLSAYNSQENANKSFTQDSKPLVGDISDSDNVLSVMNCPFKESLLSYLHCMHDTCCGCYQYQPGGQICSSVAARNCKDSSYYRHYCPLCFDEFNWQDSPASNASSDDSVQTTDSPTKANKVMSGIVDEMLKD